jgi:hypothetical protein
MLAVASTTGTRRCRAASMRMSRTSSSTHLTFLPVIADMVITGGVTEAVVTDPAI